MLAVIISFFLGAGVTFTLRKETPRVSTSKAGNAMRSARIQIIRGSVDERPGKSQCARAMSRVAERAAPGLRGCALREASRPADRSRVGPEQVAIEVEQTFFAQHREAPG